MDAASLRRAGEIIKEAAPLMPAVSQYARYALRAIKGPMKGTAIGAGVGAGLGAARGYSTRGEGESGVGAALRGGIGGAVLGGAAGAGTQALGQRFRDVRLLNPSLTAGGAVGATARSLGTSAKNVAARQWHGLTGAYSGRPGDIGLRSSATSEKHIDLLQKRMDDALKRGKATAEDVTDTHVQMALLREEGRRGDAALSAGITSIPGLAKGLAMRPGQTLRAVGREAMSGGKAGLALGVGAPLAFSAPSLLRGDESAEGGKTMRQKIVGLGGNLAAGTLTLGMPMIPQSLAMTGIESGVSRALGGRRAPLPEAMA